MGFIIPGVTLTCSELNYLRLILLALPFLPISTSTIIFFQALGKGKKATSLPIARQLVLFIPMILLVPYFKGLVGIYYVLLAENICYAVLLWVTLELNMQKLKQQITMDS